MNVSTLYALYRRAYAEALGMSDGRGGSAPDVAVARDLAALERAIVELALHDVTEGTPMRSRSGFDLAVDQGASLLCHLGLDARDLPGAARELAEAG